MVLIALAAAALAVSRPLSESQAVELPGGRYVEIDRILICANAASATPQPDAKAEPSEVVPFIGQGRTAGVDVRFRDNSPRDPEIVNTGK